MLLTNSIVSGRDAVAITLSLRSFFAIGITKEPTPPYEGLGSADAKMYHIPAPAITNIDLLE